jgi:hypothetical protein
MLSTASATATSVVAGFRAKPEYAGTIHDDDSAKVYGYRGALVPGIILYGYMADVVARSWGMDWVARGTMRSHSRRPAYEGDRMVITASPVSEDAAGKSVTMEMRDEAGNLVAAGGATLPNATASAPNLADFPVQPIVVPLPPIAPGGFKPGDRFGNKPDTVDAEALKDSLALFGQTWPVFAAEGIIHPSKFPQAATHAALSSYALPTPSIYVSAETQHLGLARVGETLTSSGYVTNVYERKGNHYTDQLHVVFANGRPVALVKRTSIYAARKER